MTAAKKIGLVVTLAVVIGAIWYLESLTVHPAAQQGNGAGESIGIVASSTSGATSTTSAAGTSASVSEAVAMVAAADQKAGYQPAKEIVDSTGFVNATSGFKLANLVGKDVVLLDFWTYSCINCIRTIPYLNAWYGKYKDMGLVIVGIHTPEFDFEKNLSNVQAAVQKYGIQYPVVLDSNYGTWTAYGNLYWPHEYLIDIAGYIIHDHIGEGDYDTTESFIQKALDERAVALGAGAAVVPTSTVSIAPANLSGIGSPETYFGAARNEYLANGMSQTPGTQTLTTPQSVVTNQLYLVGTWNFADQYATNVSAGAKVIFKYDAANVYFVASAPSGATVHVYQDGAPVTAAASGSDVTKGVLTVGASRLYNVIANPDGAGEHTLELIIDQPGLQAFTFTFG
jgi:thiol-disulfide isomerase/thioredoxin